MNQHHYQQHRTQQIMQLICPSHQEPVKGICLFHGNCSQRLICRNCRRTHDNNHLNNYEELDDLMNGNLANDIMKDFDKLLKGVEHQNRAYQKQSQTLAIETDSLFKQVQDLIFQKISEIRQFFQNDINKKINTNINLKNKLITTGSEIDHFYKIAISSNFQPPHVIENLVGVLFEAQSLRSHLNDNPEFCNPQILDQNIDIFPHDFTKNIYNKIQLSLNNISQEIFANFHSEGLKQHSQTDHVLGEQGFSNVSRNQQSGLDPQNASNHNFDSYNTNLKNEFSQNYHEANFQNKRPVIPPTDLHSGNTFQLHSAHLRHSNPPFSQNRSNFNQTNVILNNQAPDLYKNNHTTLNNSNLGIFPNNLPSSMVLPQNKTEATYIYQDFENNQHYNQSFKQENSFRSGRQTPKSFDNDPRTKSPTIAQQKNSSQKILELFSKVNEQEKATLSQKDGPQNENELTPRRLNYNETITHRNNFDKESRRSIAKETLISDPRKRLSTPNYREKKK